jgi:hypothetical protein
MIAGALVSNTFQMGQIEMTFVLALPSNSLKGEPLSHSGGEQFLLQEVRRLRELNVISSLKAPRQTTTVAQVNFLNTFQVAYQKIPNCKSKIAHPKNDSF